MRWVEMREKVMVPRCPMPYFPLRDPPKELSKTTSIYIFIDYDIQSLYIKVSHTTAIHM